MRVILITNDGLVDDSASVVVDDVHELACRLSRRWWLRSNHIMKVILITNDSLIDDGASVVINDVDKLACRSLCSR